MIDYIVNDDRYPNFIKNHKIFKSIDSIYKIFPEIGLPNSVFEIDEDITVKARIADSLLKDIYSYLAGAVRNIPSNNKSIINTFIDCYKQLYVYDSSIRKKCISFSSSNKITCRFYDNIFLDGKIFIKKDEKVFSAYKKIAKLVAPFFKLNDLESFSFFKEFSKTNSSSNKTKVKFSSTGPEGAWDIATISMRGIQSCQSWNSHQSRGLIGSITHKGVGVLLIEGSNETKYGPTTNARALVRYAKDNDNDENILMIDGAYGVSASETIISAFKNLLHSKTGLKVFNRGGKLATLISDPDTTKYLNNGEFTYIDDSCLYPQ